MYLDTLGLPELNLSSPLACFSCTLTFCLFSALHPGRCLGLPARQAAVHIIFSSEFGLLALTTLTLYYPLSHF